MSSSPALPTNTYDPSAAFRNPNPFSSLGGSSSSMWDMGQLISGMGGLNR